MNRFEYKYRANHMCYDSISDHIFISSSVQRILDASGNQLGNELHYGKYATIRLSENGRYLALFDSNRKMTLIDTNSPEHPVFTKTIGKRNEVHNENNIYFVNNQSMVFSVQHILYYFSLNPQNTLYPIYIGDQEKNLSADWKKTGYIPSLSCNRHIIVALHYCFEPSTTYIVAIFIDNGSSVIKRELPHEISNCYHQVCVMPDNAICLFSRYHDKPMLYYASFPLDFSKPDLEIRLPPVHAPCFSNDGKYLTFSVTDKEHPYGDCYLIDTTDWTVKESVHNNSVYNPSFSNDGKLWLVPGKRSYIYQL